MDATEFTEAGSMCSVLTNKRYRSLFVYWYLKTSSASASKSLLPVLKILSCNSQFIYGNSGSSRYFCIITFCMLKRYFPFLLIGFIIVACTKGKLESRPSIKLKKLNGNVFVLDSTTFFIPDLVMTITYDDKEGDLGNGVITYIRNRLNIKPIENPSSNDKTDTIRSMIPDFPKTSTGDIEITFPGSFLIEDPRENDTMNFKIFVQDVAGNISDTITTPVIVQRKG